MGNLVENQNVDTVSARPLICAVAYSAGLNDHLLQRKLKTPDATYTNSGITLWLKNAIDSKIAPSWKDEATPRSHV